MTARLDDPLGSENLSCPVTSPVAEYYRGRSIFVTGGTGFLGKVILEKLLRCCPDVQKVYLLVRPKRNLDARARLNELLSSKVWDLVRQENPSVLCKLSAVEGDITYPQLGISPEDQDSLTKEVSVVFHAAATVRFNEPLRVAVSYNLEGTQKVADLARRMTNLQAFVHMSTAFSNCNRQEIGETVYPSHIKPQDILSLLEWVDDQTLDVVAPRLTRGHPNTYTFTKLLAENYLADRCKDLPVTIIRPAIVTGSWKEPFPGWVDNTYGPSGLFAAVRRGLLRTTLVKNKVSVEVTPVDVVANLVLVAASQYNISDQDQSWPVVLNYSSGPINSLRMDVLYDSVLPRLLRPSSTDGVGPRAVRSPYYQPSSCPASYGLRCALRHYLPAALADLCDILRAKKPRTLLACRRLQKVLSEYMYFTLNEWSFQCDRATELLKVLSVEDEKIFGFNLKKVEWPSYMQSYAEGVCRFVLGEAVDSEESGVQSTTTKTTNGQWSLVPTTFKAWGLTIGIIILLLKYIKVFQFIMRLLARHTRA